MIKAAGAAGGQQLLVLGLSDENLKRLGMRQPIHIGADEMTAMGLPELEVVIMTGATEDAIVADLRATGWIPG